MQKYGDVGPLSDWQRHKLCEMMYRAFLEIRSHAVYEPERISDLADAFHNLPAMLYGDEFSIKYFRLFLKNYQEKYPDDQSEKYLQMLDKIVEENDL